MTYSELRSELIEATGIQNVYFQPPNNTQIAYPAIIINLNTIYSSYADNKKYKKDYQYQLLYIHKYPDLDTIDKILSLDYSRFERQYRADNLYHDVFNIY